jgi:hypothetical protein
MGMPLGSISRFEETRKELQDNRVRTLECVSIQALNNDLFTEQVGIRMVCKKSEKCGFGTIHGEKTAVFRQEWFKSRTWTTLSLPCRAQIVFLKEASMLLPAIRTIWVAASTEVSPTGGSGDGNKLFK